MTGAGALPVLGDGLDEARIHALVQGRSVLGRVRRLVGRTPEAMRVEAQLYWPIALVHATARSTGRRSWVDRVQGAVDLVTGRVGLVDMVVPEVRDARVDPGDCIPWRLSRSTAELTWHEHFRDHVDRKHKPLRPPSLSVDRIQRVWLPNHVVAVDDRRYLVDPMVARVEPLEHFAGIEALLADRTPETTRRLPCKA